MNPTDENDIAALIGSRICHDLVNPVGAIGNGVELLGMTGAASEELTLVSDSVALAQARIRLFRLAFGTAAPQARISGRELADTIAAPGLHDRLQIACTLPEDLPRRQARLAALLLMCSQSAMPRGGQIDLQMTDDGGQIEARATPLRLDLPPLGALAAGAAMPPLTPAEVHFALARAALAETGRQLHLASGEGWLRLSF